MSEQIKVVAVVFFLFSLTFREWLQSVDIILLYALNRNTISNGWYFETQEKGFNIFFCQIYFLPLEFSCLMASVWSAISKSNDEPKVHIFIITKSDSVSFGMHFSYILFSQCLSLLSCYTSCLPTRLPSYLRE